MNFVFKDRIIIFGDTIQTYCTLSFLLYQKKIPETHIILVIPPTDTADGSYIPPLNDPFIERQIYNVLHYSKVQIHQNYKLVAGEIDDHNNIKTVQFSSSTETLSYACTLFISNDKCCVSETLVKAFMSSDLVFDGRLVIDTDFRTNDANIYAAGPITRYKSSLYADQFAHENFNSIEIGHVLSLQLLQRFTEKTIYENNRQTVYEFTKPIIKRCVLPGPFHYLSVCEPGAVMSYKLAKLLGKNVS